MKSGSSICRRLPSMSYATAAKSARRWTTRKYGDISNLKVEETQIPAPVRIIEKKASSKAGYSVVPYAHVH